MNQFEYQGYIAASQGKAANENPHASLDALFGCPLEAFTDWAQGWEWWHIDNQVFNPPVQASKPVHVTITLQVEGGVDKQSQGVKVEASTARSQRR